MIRILHDSYFLPDFPALKAPRSVLGAPGPLSSVDVQLLRLDLADDRGRMSLSALTRLLSGDVDGSSGHPTVAVALRALLRNARAQLDRQVEVRMRQAATRPTASAHTATPQTRAPSKSPPERRVRLEFD